MLHAGACAMGTTIVPSASAGRVYTPDTAVPSTSNVTGVSSITGLNTSKMPPMPSSADPPASTRSPTAAVSSIAPPAVVEGDSDLEGHVDGVGERIEAGAV
jgi:hypothetical protein